MSKLEALEESWHFSALHAELDVIFPPFHLRETMTCCGDECGCSVQLELSAQLGFGISFEFYLLLGMRVSFFFSSTSNDYFF